MKKTIICHRLCNTWQLSNTTLQMRTKFLTNTVKTIDYIIKEYHKKTIAYQAQLFAFHIMLKCFKAYKFILATMNSQTWHILRKINNKILIFMLFYHPHINNTSFH